MRKFEFSFLSLTLILAVATPAHAQQSSATPTDPTLAAMSQAPNIGQEGMTPQVSAPAATSVAIGYGPINMRPGAFIARNDSQSAAAQRAQAAQFGTLVSGVAASNSVSAYNRSLTDIRVGQGQGNGLIPSPFPSNFAR